MDLRERMQVWIIEDKMLAYFESNGMQEELQAYQLNDMKIIVRMNGLNLKTDQLNLCVTLLHRINYI